MLLLLKSMITASISLSASHWHGCTAALRFARMVYFMLTRGEAFVDEGQQRYEEQQRQRNIAALRRRASALGFETPRPVR